MGLVVKIGANLEKFDKEMGRMTRDIKTVGDKFKNAGAAMSTGLTLPIIAGVGLVTKGTEELRGDLARLDQNARDAGKGTEFIHDALTRLSGVSDETDSNVEALSNLLATGFSESGLVSTMDALSGAMIKFPDTLKIEGLADGLQETLATGKAIGPFAEMLERLGMDLDTFNEGLAEARENGEEENYILQTLAKHGLSDVNEEYRKNNEALVESKESSMKFQQAIAELGNTLAPIVTKITNATAGLIEKFNNLSPTTKKVIMIIAGVLAVLGPLLTIGGFIIVMIGQMSAAMAILNLTMGPLILIILAVVAALAAIIAVIVYWDEIKAFFIGFWEDTKRVFSAAWKYIKEKSIAIFNGLIDFFKEWGPLILAVITGPIGWIAYAVAKYWDEIKAFTKKMFNGLVDFFKEWGPLILAAITGPIGWIVYAVTTNWDKISSTTSDVFNSMKDNVLSAWGGIKSGIKDAINWIIRKINSFIGGFNKQVKKLNKIPGVDVPTVPEIPMLAKGGHVSGSGQFIVGEAGPELVEKSGSSVSVTPLSSAEKAGGIGGAIGAGVTVNINGDNHFSNRNDIDYFIEQLGNQTRTKMRALGVKG